MVVAEVGVGSAEEGAGLDGMAPGIVLGKDGFGFCLTCGRRMGWKRRAMKEKRVSNEGRARRMGAASQKRELYLSRT